MIRSPLRGWLGGKYRLAKTITAMIPDDHICYCEPFAGAAWVLFTKEPSKAEIINDINGDVVNLYRVLANHIEEFHRYFRWALISRDEFKRLMELPGECLTDVQRAARYYYIQKNCFGGRMNPPTFGVALSRPPKLNLFRIEEELSAVHFRLAGAVLENLPYGDVIKRYDRSHTVFYCDPPYFGHEHDYGKNIFSRDDFRAMAAQLGQIKGRFILSINDVPEIRDTFKGFNMREVETMYSAAGTGNQRAKELLITNFTPGRPDDGE